MDRVTRFWFAVAAATSLAFSFVPVRAASTSFIDVGASTQYRAAINELRAQGVIEGYSDGTFKPLARINRAEFLKIILSAKGSETAVVKQNCFPDVTDQWYAQYVCLAKQLDIVSGYPDGLFHPERDINFVEASKILSLAYEQKTQGTGGDWYQQYVTALESAKAIPPSIDAVDRRITRSEMAEMMWRIAEKKTDQPTKGLLNIKYPDAQVNFASDSVQVAKSCADLRAVISETNTGNAYNGRGGIMFQEALGAPMMKSLAAPTAADSATTGDYSRTNVQVEGVDEADTVKTDGTYLYIISGNAVKIVKARPAGAMSVVSTVTVDGTPSELYVLGSHLVVITDGWKNAPRPVPVPMLQKIAPDYYPMPSEQVTTALLYDLKDGTATLVRTLSFEGNLVSSRMIAGNLYLVLRSGFRWYGGPMPLSMKEADLVPTFSDSRAGGTDQPVARCGGIAILPHIPSPEFLTVAVVPADKPAAEVKTETMLGSAENVYASLKNLYVATTQWKYIWDSTNSTSSESTNIFRFAFTDDGVTLASQGSVPGHILNQFSMDENGETFRIATTTPQIWSGDGTQAQQSNNLFVLNASLQTLGALQDIAPGESIYAVRFISNRAYLVTFKQVDPLFVIDTSDPRNPRILGKLKIPGYSNYLHPYDETHLIGFGKEVDESVDADKVHNPDAVYYTAIQGVKMALFDVSDVENPKELWKEVIGDRGSDSPLLTNHKALLFDKARGLLAFPVLVTKRPAGAALSADGNPVFQGAYVYKLSIADGFKLQGTITHYTSSDAFLKAGSYWYGGSSDISRILRIQDSLLTVSPDLVKSTSWPGITAEGSVRLE